MRAVWCPAGTTSVTIGGGCGKSHETDGLLVRCEKCVAAVERHLFDGFLVMEVDEPAAPEAPAPAKQPKPRSRARTKADGDAPDNGR